MKARSDFSMTVGEIAYSMRLDLASVKAAANSNSSAERLPRTELDATLESLKRQLSFNAKGWNLSLLDDLRGSWVDSLRELYSIPVAFPASLPPSQGNQIRNLILREKPSRVLEIGCFIGISSHWIASALEDIGHGRIDSVDTFWPKYPSRYHFSYLSDPYRVASETAQRTDAGRRIHFHVSDSGAFAENVFTDEPFDFMFIDGDHTFEGVTRDFLAYFPKLRKGGTILLHDTHPEHCGWDGPRRLIDTILEGNSDVSVEEIETEPNFGMAIIRKLTDGDLTLTPQQSRGVRVRLTIYRAKNWLRGTRLFTYVLRKIAKPLATKFRHQ